MYLYLVQILGDYNDSVHSFFNKKEIIHSIPEGYIKLFTSNYPYEIVKKDHQEIYKNSNIYVQEYKDRTLIKNFSKLQEMLNKHDKGFFYHLPLHGTVFSDISSLFGKIYIDEDNLLLFDKLKEKCKKYPLLTNLVKKNIDSLNNVEDYIDNNYYNRLSKDFTKYKQTDEYKILKEFKGINILEISLIEKLSHLNNNIWKNNIKNLYNILFERYDNENFFVDYYEFETYDDFNVSIYKTWDDKTGIITDKRNQIIQKDYFSEFEIITKYKTEPGLEIIEEVSFLNDNYILKKNKEDIIEEKRIKFLKYFIFEFCENDKEISINILLQNLKSYVKKVSPGSEKIFHYKNLTPLLLSLNYKTKKKKDGAYCLNLKII